MKAVVPLSNFWEWSGGFGVIMEWVSGVGSSYPFSFYSDKKCQDFYQKTIKDIMSRVNTINGIRYSEDSTIMAWQLANEPRVGDCGVYTTWITNTAKFIKNLTTFQLVSVGNEGSITPCHTVTWNVKEVDYVTFHAWA